MSWLDDGHRFHRETKRLERPGSPDELHLRSFTNNLGETRFLIEGRRLGVHLGERIFPTYDDALAYGRMLASWEQAKLIDRVGGGR